jgi:hypothetical protein
MIPLPLIGGELDDPPAFAEPIIRAYGLAALRWGRLEQHLDALLLTVNKEAHGPAVFRDMPNTSFRMKLDLFHDWFVKDRRFVQFHERARRLKTSLKQAARDRQVLFHSNCDGFEEGPPPALRLVNMHLKGEHVIQARYAFSEEKLLHFAAGTQRLNVGLHSFTEEILRPGFLGSLKST